MTMFPPLLARARSMERHVACGMALALGMVLGLNNAHADAFQEFLGARSLAMGGAHRGVGTANETIILNPAGMALTRRYSIDALYGYGGADHINHGTLSAVDSKNSPVAAGVLYSRGWGNPTGSDASLNRIYVGGAYALSPRLGLGLTGQNIRGGYNEPGGRRDVSLYNMTAGLSLNLSQAIGVGLAYQNILAADAARLMPPNLSFGVTWRTQVLTLAYDMRFDMRTPKPHPLNLGCGAELIVRQALALRGGYRRAGTDPNYEGPTGSFITAGAAYVTPTGGLQMGFEHLIEGPSWALIGGVQIYM